MLNLLCDSPACCRHRDDPYPTTSWHACSAHSPQMREWAHDDGIHESPPHTYGRNA